MPRRADAEELDRLDGMIPGMSDWNPSAPHPGPIHVERGATSFDDPITYVRMFCGASCAVFPDGEPVPDLDWVMEKDAEKGTCAACLAARDAPAEVERKWEKVQT